MPTGNRRKRKITKQNKIDESDEDIFDLSETTANSSSSSSPQRNVEVLQITPTPKKRNKAFDLSADIFDITTYSAKRHETICLSSPESVKSPLKESNSSSQKPGIRTLKQSTPTSNSSGNIPNAAKVKQSKMDLFVKWKDPSKLGKAKRAREKLFKGSSAPEIHDSSWTVPEEEIENKFENIRSPTKKKFAGTNKKEKVNRPPKSLLQTTYQRKSPIKQNRNEINSEDEELEKQLKARREMMKQIMKEKGKETGGLLNKIQEENKGKLKEGHVIRKREDRQRMHAMDCPCCKDYYDMLGLSPTSRQKRVQQSSRHRYVNLPKPRTPEHYWDLKFTSPKNKKQNNTGSKSSVKKLF